jgi:hypothetical protein
MAQFVIMREQIPQQQYVINENYTKYTNINGNEDYANIEKVNNNGHIEIKKNINGNVEYYYEDRNPTFRNDLEHPNVHFDLHKNKKRIYYPGMSIHRKKNKKNEKNKKSIKKRSKQIDSKKDKLRPKNTKKSIKDKKKQ